ncbi:MAG: DNA mismatch repair protein MutS, partial [Methylobacteriaceae bacterium]|nr:DNA mismatch repair protein MutS [Methylobacteriaceae bacterium]
VVGRAIVRLVTPGTITEERLLEPGRANVLLAIVRVRASDEEWSYGLASVDISTGAFNVGETRDEGLGAEIARIEPREIVLSETMQAEPRWRTLLAELGVAVTPVAQNAADGISAQRRLADHFGVGTLDGLGSFSRAELAAAAAALAYVERTQLAARPNLARPTRALRGSTVEIDAATRANLELTRTASGERAGSLAGTIDLAVTPAGSRLLGERLAGPLTDPAAIDARLDAVGFLLAETGLRAELRRGLKSAPDLVRALSRLALQRGGPRDLASLGQGLAAAAAVAALLGRHDGLPAELAAAAQAAAGAEPSLALRLSEALADDLPLNRRDGGFVRPGHEPALDEARALRDESRKVIASLQARYADLAETRQLKVKHNNFLGFFIEVSQAQGEKLLRAPFNATFVHRQTMADAMRFSTTQLAELEAKIASAADRALTLELAVFDRLSAAALVETERIKAASDGLAVIDVAAALAELAATRGWTRPQVDRSLAFEVTGGRHPVVEAARKRGGDAFVANDCDLSGEGDAAGRIAVVTGPNMAGKSTYLRQNALIAVLAQMGSYVPAERGRLGVIDRLFSRVGAADDLARGRSTFMVEMVETAAILNQASLRSLVILDEIGRGTATFDGLSIAWAAIEHLHDINRSRALFATHFHELTLLAKTLNRLRNLTMRITEWNGEVVFLHEVVPGAADRSYGIQVAKLAGLPAPVIERARALLAELEASDRQAHVERLLDDLPLFAARPTQDSMPAPAPPPPKRDALRDMLDAIDPDELTPRAALEAIYRLKRQRSDERDK